jgi:hypothetical protein
MKTLKQLCKPRQSVFDRNRRDVALDLTDLIEDASSLSSSLRRTTSLTG